MESLAPAFSIVTVVRDDPEGLARTGRSIASQSERCYQWVVVDGSNDASPCRELSERLVRTMGGVLITGADRGIYDAMNKGAASSSGSHVLFLNAGDELASPSVGSSIAQHLFTVPDAATSVLYGNYELVLESGATILKAARAPDYIRHGLPTSHQAMLYPRQLLLSHPYDISYRVTGDYWLTATAITKGTNLRPIRLTVARFYRGGTSTRRQAQLDAEAARVQREVLRLPKLQVYLSQARRRANTIALRLLNHLSRARRERRT